MAVKNVQEKKIKKKFEYQEQKEKSYQQLILNWQNIGTMIKI